MDASAQLRQRIGARALRVGERLDPRVVRASTARAPCCTSPGTSSTRPDCRSGSWATSVMRPSCCAACAPRDVRVPVVGRLVVVEHEERRNVRRAARALAGAGPRTLVEIGYSAKSAACDASFGRRMSKVAWLASDRHTIAWVEWWEGRRSRSRNRPQRKLWHEIVRESHASGAIGSGPRAGFTPMRLERARKGSAWTSRRSSAFTRASSVWAGLAARRTPRCACRSSSRLSLECLQRASSFSTPLCGRFGVVIPSMALRAGVAACESRRASCSLIVEFCPASAGSGSEGRESGARTCPPTRRRRACPAADADRQARGSWRQTARGRSSRRDRGRSHRNKSGPRQERESEATSPSGCCGANCRGPRACRGQRSRAVACVARYHRHEPVAKRSCLS